MVVAVEQPNIKPAVSHPKPNLAGKYFYSGATLAIFVIVFVGFRYFYLQGKAYPDRPLTPPIRNLVIAHGLSMSAWMLVATLQPILVASGYRNIHRTVGRVASIVMLAVIGTGLWVAIASTRVSPPQRVLNGLAPHPFMVVQLLALVVYALFIGIALWKRKRPAIHKPLMFLATLMVSTAGMGRIDAFNSPFAGTWIEYHFSAFPPMLVIGAALLGIKWLLDGKLDRVFAIALAGLALACCLATHLSRTSAWEAFVTWLIA